MVNTVSLIIPFKSDKSDKEKLFTLLKGISSWKTVPNEIIIINTDKNQLSLPNYIELLIKKLNINFSFTTKKASTGYARNIESLMHPIHYWHF